MDRTEDVLERFQDRVHRVFVLSAADEDLPRQRVSRAYLADALTALLLAAFADTTPERASVASDLADRIRAYALRRKQIR